jgi:hypothetical protein
MASFEKTKLSELGTTLALNGAISSISPTDVHISTSSAGVLDEVWIWATAAPFGGGDLRVEVHQWDIASSSYYMVSCLTAPEGETILLVPGFIIGGNGSSSGKIALASPDLTFVTGYVNRIYP